MNTLPHNPQQSNRSQYIEVHIKKPIYGTMCYIRDIYINQARKQNIPLKVTIPQGFAVYTADEWMDGAQRMEKVFLRPDQPMILWGRNVDINKKKNFFDEYELIPEGEEETTSYIQEKLF